MELLALPGMGLDQGKYNFFMHPDQAMQFITVDDIGKIVTHVLNTPEEFIGRTPDIAGDAITAAQLQEGSSRARHRPIEYSRCSDRLLSENDSCIGWRFWWTMGARPVPQTSLRFDSSLVI